MPFQKPRLNLAGFSSYQTPVLIHYNNIVTYWNSYWGGEGGEDPSCPLPPPLYDTLTLHGRKPNSL